MIIFSFTCFLAVFLFIAFEQNTIFEYANYFKIKLPFISEYKNILESGGQSQYVSFLRGVYRDNFFVQGLTCVICFSVWASTFLSIICWDLLAGPIINFFGLVGFFLLKILSNFNNKN